MDGESTVEMIGEKKKPLDFKASKKLKKLQQAVANEVSMEVSPVKKARSVSAAAGGVKNARATNKKSSPPPSSQPLDEPSFCSL